MIEKTNADITKIQDFASNNNVRVHIDLGEDIADNVFLEIRKLKKLMGHQKVGVILGTNEEINRLKKMVALYNADPKIKQIIDEDVSNP